MKNQKANVLLSIWISVSFVIAVIGVIVIEYTILNNTYLEADMMFWVKFSQAGNILTLIGVISTFISLLIAVLLPRITKRKNTETEPVKLQALTLTKIFAITIVCIALMLAIVDISLTEYTKNVLQKIDFDSLIQLNSIKGVFSTIALYTLPIFSIIEAILIFIITRKTKETTAK